MTNQPPSLTDAFVFAIALAYAVTDLDVLQDLGTNQYPLASIYAQATAHADGSQNIGAIFGLLFIIWCSSLLCCVGTFLTNSRIYWALARDGAVPLSGLFGSVTEKLSCPVPSAILVGIFCAALGAIPLGSSTAFGDLTGSFIILSTISYAIPFFANICTGRKYFPKGPFHLGRYGYAVNILAVAFISLFNVLYCFPFYIPTDASVMNYNSVILAGVVALTALWWVVHARKHYPGPKVMMLYIHDDKVVEGTPAEAAVVQSTEAEKH
jgi:amino acid transporter